MKPVTNFFKTYFNFSKGERNGIIFLLFVLLILVIAIQMVPKVKGKTTDPEQFQSLQKEIDSLFEGKTKDWAIHDINKGFKKKERLEMKQVAIVELNSADSATLTMLPGIGPVLAGRIIKYRKLMGGFYEINQIREVYGLNDENFIKAKTGLKADKDLMTQILADTAGFRVLAKHPYIGKERAWKIINLRKKSYSGINTEELKSAGIFDSIQWLKVKPYFIFQKNSSPNKIN